jgi:hypothetical protein
MMRRIDAKSAGATPLIASLMTGLGQQQTSKLSRGNKNGLNGVAKQNYLLDLTPSPNSVAALDAGLPPT